MYIIINNGERFKEFCRINPQNIKATFFQQKANNDVILDPNLKKKRTSFCSKCPFPVNYIAYGVDMFQIILICEI